LTGSRPERIGEVRRRALPFEARPGGEAMLSGEAVSRRLAAVLAADCSPLAKAAGGGALVELAHAAKAASIAAG
jgi:hypothetical protein